ncbi:tetratricopeptide repeat protein [Flavitalea flava]
MKLILLLTSLICFLAFISAKTIFPAKKISVSAVERSTAIGCAPGETNSPGSNLAGAGGRFIHALPGLGHHQYAITTQNDSARFFFNQGLNFYYSYHLREALASFREAALFDSTAAMTYWGQALSMGPYYNIYYYKLKMGIPAALAAMNRHRGGATEKENGLMDAIQQRYSYDTTNADRPQLDSSYAMAMSGLIRQYPEDNDIKALYIDAVMLEHKWDFWNTDRTPKTWTPELVTICETILKKDPHHPGGLHYYIHLTEASDKPELALPWANVLKEDMPGAGHMVHMATHSYQRNGLFVKGVKVNEDANAVVNREDSLSPEIGLGKNKLIHVYEVQSYCAMNAGMYSKGMPLYLRARERLLAGKPSFEQDPDAQFVYMFPVLAWVRLGKWEEIRQSPAPDNKWKYASILYHFASGLANVHHKDLPTAKADLDSLEGNLQDSLLGIRIMPFNKPVQCGRIAAGILRGEILFAEGKQDEALAAFNLAVQEEDELIYSEPPEWLIPVRQYLGLCLLKMHQTKEAEKVYRDDLSRNPGNGWSLLGLYQSLMAQHKPAEAAGYKLKYQTAFEASDVNPVASVF